MKNDISHVVKDQLTSNFPVLPLTLKLITIAVLVYGFFASVIKKLLL